MVMVHLYVPAKMIFNKEAVLAQGKDYRFKTAPIDPYDPFRGKYIDLYYEANAFHILLIGNIFEIRQRDDGSCSSIIL